MRIEVCGIIASGKTTLARLIADEINDVDARFVEEKHNENPFLKKYYNDPLAYFIEKNITFMLMQYAEIKMFQKYDLLVCDFAFIQDLAYADIFPRTKEDRKIIHHTYSYIQNKIRDPDIILNIRCPIDLAMKRISERNREEEQKIDETYLQKLNTCLADRIREIERKRCSTVLQIDDDNQLSNKVERSIRLIKEKISV